MKIFLSYNAFKWFEIDSYLSALIRMVIYFKNRGLNGSSVKWNHCGATDLIDVWEAKLTFKKHNTTNAFKPYEDVLILEPCFRFDAVIFERILSGEIGKRYGFWGVVCQFFYQCFGFKLQKDFRFHYCSSALAKAFYFSCSEDIKHKFSNYAYTDPQDFVRMWKEGLFIKVK